nr:putative ribonuclease H-like domain-containing protein [Tanacetum cinerariifolium]
PKEDPANYPANEGDNDDDESSNDDDDDDVEKDEEEEHLAPADPSALEPTNKGHKVPRAHTAWPINKKTYAGSLPLCNQCKFPHNGPCTINNGNCKKVGHIIQNYRTHATNKNKRTHTCYECGSLRHYKSECTIVKFYKRVDMIHGGVRASKPKTMQDAIENATKLMNKKISTLIVCQAENKRKLDNTSKNNQKQQQSNKRQNIGRAYTAGHGEKKHYNGSKPMCSKCNYHHNGPCTRASQKATCYECRNQGHYRRDCPERKNQNHENQIESTEAYGVVHAFGGGETKQDLNNIEDEIETHMTGNKSFLTEYQEIVGGFVAFGGSPKGGKITRKGKIRTGKLNFDYVYFVKELTFNLFSVSQMCDKKDSVIFTKIECLVLSTNFKLLDESQVLLKVLRTLQHNRVAERKNKTLIKEARTMLADSLLPTIFWAKAVNTACYVQKSILVTKPYNKTPYELLIGRSPNLEFLRPFGCHVTILNILDYLGKFDSKDDEGFLVGYSVNSKEFRIFNSKTRKVKENMHVNFLENKPNVVGSGPEWLFDIDPLTKSMNYEPVTTGNQSNGDADVNAGDIPRDLNLGDIQGDTDEISRNDDVCQGNKIRIHSSTQAVNAANPSINTASTVIDAGSLNINIADSNDTNMPTLEAIGIFDGAFDDRDLGAETDINNLDSSTVVSPIPTTRVYKDHPKEQISKEEQIIKFFRTACLLISYPKWNPRRNKARLVAQGHTQEEGIDYDEVFVSVARIETIRLFLAYASFKDSVVYQMDVKSAFLYGKIKEEVYVCQPPRFEDPDLPDKVYKVKKALYSLHQALELGDILLVQVYVDDIIFGSTKKEMCDAFEILMHENFQMSLMGEITFFLGLQVKQKQDDIFINQDKYVAEILKKFRLSEVNIASTLMETSKPLLKDEDGQEVDVHMYKSMIDSLMYLTSLRPDTMFADLVWTGNLQLVDVNSLAVDLYPGSAKSRQWLQTPQLRLSMLLLQVVVDMYSGYKINYLITRQTATGKDFSNLLMDGSFPKSTNAN